MKILNRRGSYNVLFVTSFPIIAGFAAAGIDFGAVSVARYQTQMAADDGALAAVNVIENLADYQVDELQQAEITAAAYASSHEVNGLAPSVQIEVGHWAAETKAWTYPPEAGTGNAMKVTASVEVPTPFWGMMRAVIGGDPKPSVTVSSSAGAAPNVAPARTPDLVIVLDVTTSMNDGSEMANMRAASLALVECINERSTDDSRAAIVAFTGIDKTLLGMSAYGDYYGEMTDILDDLPNCLDGGIAPVCGSTNQASGLAGARYILENAETPEGVGQAVILFSDGAPTSKDEGSSDVFDGDNLATKDSTNSYDGTCNYFYDNGGYTTTYVDQTPNYSFSRGTAGSHFDFAARCASGPSFKSKKACTTYYTTGSSKGKCKTWGAAGATVTIWNDTTTDHVKAWNTTERSLLLAEDVDLYTVYYGDAPSGSGTYTTERDYMASLAESPDMAYDTPDSANIADLFEDICVAYSQGAAGLIF